MMAFRKCILDKFGHLFSMLDFVPELSCGPFKIDAPFDARD
jgi:hypothetical protein